MTVTMNVFIVHYGEFSVVPKGKFHMKIAEHRSAINVTEYMDLLQKVW